jgi:hypothetical protein
MERGNVVMMFADSGWKYLDTGLWSGAPLPEDDDELDEVIWW